jgi:hypothetical protein
LSDQQNLIEPQTPSTEPTQATVADQSAAPTATPSPNPALTVAGNQNLSEPQTPVQKPDQSFVPRQSTAQTLTPSTNAIQPLTLSSNPVQTLVPVQDSTQTIAASQTELPMQPGKQQMETLPAITESVALNSLPVADAAAASPSVPLQAAPVIESKSGTSSGGKAATPGTVRPARGAGNSDAAQPGKSVLTGQSTALAVDASAVTRELDGARGTSSTAGESAGGKTAAATGPDTRETFATLDAQGAPGSPVWIHAGGQRAEAGFQDPALGWVGVRADASGGGVHAELVAGSADAAQALGSQMAGLNAYLAEHHTPVETLTLSAPADGGTGMGSGQTAGQNMQQQTGQETAQGGDAGFPSSPSPDRTMLSAAASAARSAGLDGSAQAAQWVGGHISVMA